MNSDEILKQFELMDQLEKDQQQDRLKYVKQPPGAINVSSEATIRKPTIYEHAPWLFETLSDLPYLATVPTMTALGTPTGIAGMAAGGTAGVALGAAQKLALKTAFPEIFGQPSNYTPGDIAIDVAGEAISPVAELGKQAVMNKVGAGARRLLKSREARLHPTEKSALDWMVQEGHPPMLPEYLGHDLLGNIASLPLIVSETKRESQKAATNRWLTGKAQELLTSLNPKGSAFRTIDTSYTKTGEKVAKVFQDYIDLQKEARNDAWKTAITSINSVVTPAGTKGPIAIVELLPLLGKFEEKYGGVLASSTNPASRLLQSKIQAVVDLAGGRKSEVLGANGKPFMVPGEGVISYNNAKELYELLSGEQRAHEKMFAGDKNNPYYKELGDAVAALRASIDNSLQMPHLGYDGTQKEALDQAKAATIDVVNLTRSSPGVEDLSTAQSPFFPTSLQVDYNEALEAITKSPTAIDKFLVTADKETKNEVRSYFVQKMLQEAKTAQSTLVDDFGDIVLKGDSLLAALQKTEPTVKKLFTTEQQYALRNLANALKSNQREYSKLGSFSSILMAGGAFINIVGDTLAIPISPDPMAQAGKASGKALTGVALLYLAKPLLEKALADPKATIALTNLARTNSFGLNYNSRLKTFLKHLGYKGRLPVQAAMTADDGREIPAGGTVYVEDGGDFKFYPEPNLPQPQNPMLKEGASITPKGEVKFH